MVVACLLGGSGVRKYGCTRPLLPAASSLGRGPSGRACSAGGGHLMMRISQRVAGTAVMRSSPVSKVAPVISAT